MEKSENEVFSLGKIFPLGSLPIGTSGSIVSISGEGKLKRRLFDMGLTPGASLFLRKKAPLGDPLEITIRGYELTLRHQEADYVSVKINALSDKGNK